MFSFRFLTFVLSFFFFVSTDIYHILFSINIHMLIGNYQLSTKNDKLIEY